MSEALRLAKALEYIPDKINKEAAAELRRLHDENKYLQDEIIEQACLNGMGSSREAQLMALNAELVKALKHAAECVQTNYLPDKCGHDWDDVIVKAEASNGS